MMKSTNTICLVFKQKVFQIPSDLLIMSNVHSNILNSLQENGRYEVKSNVSQTIFQQFLQYLTNKIIPEFNPDNISQFDQLSQEFNFMKNLVKMYKKSIIFSLKIREQYLKEVLFSERNKLNKKNESFQRIISFLFENKGFDCFNRFIDFKDELFNECYFGNVEAADLLTRKFVEQDGLLFALSADSQTAGVLSNLNQKGDIFIPKTIQYDSKEYKVTIIHRNAFKEDRGIISIQFPSDSELRLIETDAFQYSSIRKITIPQHVTKLERYCFYCCRQLANVEFQENSELKFIGESAFSQTLIQSISIPPSVEVLEEGWCNAAENLIEVKLMGDNSHFKYIDGNMIVCKSDQKSDEYDVLLFVPHNMKKVTIPSCIKRIASFAFYTVELENIEFEPNSKLESIGRRAFAETSFECISIPSSVTVIEENAFKCCNVLKKVLFQEDSQLKIIKKYAFSQTSLESIVIPKHVTELEDYVFFICIGLKRIEFAKNSELKTIGFGAFSSSYCETLCIPSGIVNLHKYCFSNLFYLKNIIIMPSSNENIRYIEDSFIVRKTNPKSDIFDDIIFARRDIEHACIPSCITRISSISFNDCKKLKTIAFPNNIQLKIICDLSFSNSSIERITIPLHVTQIDISTFSDCKKLKTLEFSSVSEIKTIGKCLFTRCSIEKIVIPDSVSQFEDGWCCGASNLKIIEISPNNKYFSYLAGKEIVVGKTDLESEIFDTIIFASREIQHVTIPSYIKVISPDSFSYCKRLKSVNFQPDLHLQTIGCRAFSNSGIEHICIPSSVSQIDEDAFNYCYQLRSIEFEKNSKLRVLEPNVFSNSSIVKITVPSSVAIIRHSAFDECEKLEMILFTEDSQLKLIEQNAFSGSSIRSIIIPKHVSRVENCAFAYCRDLKIVEIQEGSKIRFIKTKKFKLDKAANMMIPKKNLKILAS